MVRGAFLSLWAETDIPARSLVAVGSGANTVKLATSNSDVIIGVSDDVDVSATRTASVQVSLVGEVVAAGVITPGASITADASGKAVAGSGRVVGVSLHDAVAGDVIEVLIQPGKV